MNAKHTPGPWRIGEYAVNDYCPTIYGPDGFAICTMEQGNVNIADIVEADARLIAACPDMLEAINRAIFAIENGTPSCRTTLDDILYILKPSFKKALGE